MPAGSYGRYGTLIPDNTPFNVKGTLDLSGTEPVYNVTEKAKFIHTQLNQDKTSSSQWIYEVILLIPATDLSDQPLTFSITSDKGYAYEAFFQGKNFEAGKAYVLEGTANDAMITNAKLIAAAESDNSITFKKESGKVNVNDATNQTLLKQVKKIIVNEKNDPTICEQIGYFTALTNLNCYYNQLTSLDVSKNTALTILNCGENKLTFLDVSSNTALTDLDCAWNDITSLDVSHNTELTILTCYINQLTSLDVSNNIALIDLTCSSNQLTSLNISNNIALTSLHCNYNQLTSLDVSNNTALAYLYCGSNQLETYTVKNHSSLKTLDISKSPKLTSLDCLNNILTNLNINRCIALKSLDCNKNRLTKLNISSFFPTLTRYYVFCGNQKNADGVNQTMTLTHNAQDYTTFREETLRNYNVTLVAAD